MNSESQFTFAADNRVAVHCDVNTLEITMSSVAPEIALSRVLPEVTAFLQQSPLKMFIRGAWVQARSGKTFETRDPGTGERLADVASGDKSDIDAAVDAATTAFRKVWLGYYARQ